MPVDGSEAVAENFIEGDALTSILRAKQPGRVVDLRAPAARAKAPLAGSQTVTLEDLAAGLKGNTLPVLLVADHEVFARTARQKLIELAVPSGQIFVVRRSGGDPTGAQEAGRAKVIKRVSSVSLTSLGAGRYRRAL